MSVSNYSKFICDQYIVLFEKVYNISEIIEKIWDICESYYDGDIEINLYFDPVRGPSYEVGRHSNHGKFHYDEDVTDWKIILEKMEEDCELSLYIYFKTELDDKIRGRIEVEFPNLKSYELKRFGLGYDYLRFTIPKLM